MTSSVIILFFLATLSLSVKFETPVVGTYFPNWAQYNDPPYKFTPSSLSPIINKLNIIYYAFAYFCPESSWTQQYWVPTDCVGISPGTIVPIEPNDHEYYRQVTNYKSQNTDLKVILSIGGWNFPSAYFSGMVANSTMRTQFIASAMDIMKQYDFDGIDIDWEYPCSPPRTDPVKISCTDFQYETDDGGGSCDDDSANFLTFIQEMRQSFGNDYMITMAAQADMTKATNGFKLQELTQYIDLFNLMTYDYTVSDDPGSNITAPNEPLYTPTDPDILQDSVSTTVKGYINLGVPASQLVIGIAYYGHNWYVPDLTGTDWQQFGLEATIQGECCLSEAQTYGGKYGKYSGECGSYAYYEIVDAGFDTYFDETTATDIGYAINPIDGYTAKGIWISYQGPQTITANINYCKSLGLAGAFVFDISQDTVQNGQHTFNLTNLVYTLENS